MCKHTQAETCIHRDIKHHVARMFSPHSDAERLLRLQVEVERVVEAHVRRSFEIEEERDPH